MPNGGPLVRLLQPPAWWDAAVYILLADRLFPRFEGYAPIDAGDAREIRLLRPDRRIRRRPRQPARCRRFPARQLPTSSRRPDRALWSPRRAASPIRASGRCGVRPGIARLAELAPGAAVPAAGDRVRFLDRARCRGAGRLRAGDAWLPSSRPAAPGAAGAARGGSNATMDRLRSRRHHARPRPLPRHRSRAEPASAASTTGGARPRPCCAAARSTPPIGAVRHEPRSGLARADAGGATGRHWVLANLRLLRDPPTALAAGDRLVSILIPVRNEARCIGGRWLRRARSRGAGRDPGDGRRLDRSRPRSSSELQAATLAFVCSPRRLCRRVVGQVHACQLLADAARGVHLLFVDADVTRRRMPPRALPVTRTRRAWPW